MIEKDAKKALGKALVVCCSLVAAYAAWGDVLRVQRADNEELLELAREAGISTYGLEEDN